MEVFKIERENMITVKHDKDCEKKAVVVSELPAGTTFRAKWNGNGLALFVRSIKPGAGSELTTFCLEKWPGLSGGPFAHYQGKDSRFWSEIELVDIEICVKPVA